MREITLMVPEGAFYEVAGWYGEDGGPADKTMLTRSESEAMACAQAWDEYDGCSVTAYRHTGDGRDRIYPRLGVVE